ncbi:HAD family phosphatase [Methylococcus sp. EFPC2]|uniref:HAD family hydrolase n=1 Tax=Methylococcus sp. EFPC2 TaxID=2812648 RepID=UPI001966F133|nr:HAD family phosphatase [Methylococcus sp. EFPC2]QSA96223.1 HAD family phosphatase [Methylococcus sp. EFPC2]
MSMLPAFDAVLFDLDGLVLDTESTYLHAWRRAAAEFETVLSDDVGHALFGRHADGVMQALQVLIGPRFERSRFEAAASKYWHEYLDSHGIALMPGVTRLLEQLTQRRIPYALATNSDARYAELCLMRAGIDAWFRVRVSRDQVRAGKPEPDLFLEAARRLAVPSGRCLALEDSLTGLTAACRAGTLPVLVQARPVAVEALEMAIAHFRTLDQVADAIESTQLSTDPQCPYHSQVT